MSERMSSTNWGWILAAVTLLAAGNLTYEFAVVERWTSMMMLGILIPIGALIDWHYLRRRSDEARVVADRGLVFLPIILIWIAFTAGG
jgi:hypothetical protein